jgi:hypothetical protein
MPSKKRFEVWPHLKTQAEPPGGVVRPREVDRPSGGSGWAALRRMTPRKRATSSVEYFKPSCASIFPFLPASAGNSTKSNKKYPFIFFDNMLL